MTRGLGRERLCVLFVAAWMLLNFPLLALWDRDVSVWGLPLFPTALFALWAALVGALAWFMEAAPD